MKFKRVIVAFTLLAFGASSRQAPAQIQGVFNMGALTNTLSQGAIVKSESERGARMRGRGVRSSSKKQTGRGSTRTVLTLGTFKQSAAVRKRYLSNFLTKMRVTEPENAAALQKTFATKDVFGFLGKKMGQYGLKTNNIADPMALYLVISWNGIRGRNDDPNKAHLLGVRNQMARALTNVPALKRMTDAQKQEWADSLLLKALLVDGSVDIAKKQPSQMAQLKANIATGARATLGLDLNRMRLTNEGLLL